MHGADLASQKSEQTFLFCRGKSSDMYLGHIALKPKYLGRITSKPKYIGGHIALNPNYLGYITASLKPKFLNGNGNQAHHKGGDEVCEAKTMSRYLGHVALNSKFLNSGGRRGGRNQVHSRG